MKKVNLLTLAKREQTQQPKVARWLDMLDTGMMNNYERGFVDRIKKTRVLTTKQMKFLRKLANGGYRGESLEYGWLGNADAYSDMDEMMECSDRGSY